MKKIVIGLLATVLAVSPVVAQHHRDNDEHHYSHNKKHYDNRNKKDDFVLGLIVGGIAGAIISNNHGYNDERDRDYRRHHRNDRRHYRNSYRYCTVEQVVEYRYDRKYIYNIETCNY